ncbi:hypothetical protein QL285_057179 [Trifolium repens]|nr:hypothetical protein QL285_057179 [Trifolium repens]
MLFARVNEFQTADDQSLLKFCLFAAEVPAENNPQILLCRRSCFVDDPSPLSDPSPSSDASPSQSEFSAVQHRSVYRLAFLVLRAFSSTVMSSISSPHLFSQRFGILSFDCKGNERYYSNLNLHVLVVNLKFGIDVFSTKDCQLRLIIIQFCRSIQVRVPIL